jgi:hypothetical protein
LYEYETWSLTVKEEHNLRVFENRVLRRIFGSKGGEVTESWRRLHNEGRHNLSKDKGKVVPVLNLAPHHEGVLG